MTTTSKTSREDSIRNIETALSELLRAGDIETLRACMTRVIERMGYRCFTYVDARKPRPGANHVPFHITTLPDNFLSTYLDQGCLQHDPVIRRGISTNTPFAWSDLVEHRMLTTRSQRGPRPTSLRVMALANDHGFADGFVVPIHGYSRQHGQTLGLITLFWSNEPREMVEFTPSWLLLVCHFFHQRVCELRDLPTDSEDEFGDDVLLSDREIECLSWGAQGLTQEQVADVLGLSPRTVETYYQKACMKLGARTKVQAVAVAVNRGLISL